MHVHACDNEDMRTTIEMKPEHRARILEIAASKGHKGFSAIVSEALDYYLEAEKRRKEAQRRLLKLKGSITEDEADQMRAEIRKLRASWR